MSSVAVTQSFGRAGTTKIDSGYNTTTVSGYFGKGFGDIPFGADPPFRDHRRAGLQHSEYRADRRRQHHHLVGRADAAILDPLPAVADQGLWAAEHPRQPDATGRTQLDFGRRHLHHPADQQPDHLPARYRRGLDRTLLCHFRRGALAAQRRCRAQHRRDRAVPSLFRRPDAEHARQADIAVVIAMRWTHWLLPAMLVHGVAGFRACLPATRQPAGRQRIAGLTRPP